VSLFDQAVSARESRANTRTDEALVERAKTGEVRQLLLQVILPVLADPAIPDEQVGGLLREQIGAQRLREAAAGGWKPLPGDHGRLAAMDSSLINFALLDLVGKVLSPRIRDLGKITMIRDDTPAATAALYPHAGPLLSARWNEDLVAGCWTDLLRMAGALKYGQATASLVVGKWSAASRQNTLAAGLKEWGMLRRTIHAAQYLSDPVYRRKIARQLNKGESLHALRRDLHYAQQGTISKPHLADQTEQAWCLTVLTNSVITWTTEYYQLAVQQLRGQGRDVPDEILAHISPAHSENVNFFGVITVDVEAELAKLDPAGWRPLRAAAPDLSLLP
jgi:hypothetical protein